jgi:hypothetical protein
MGREVLMDRRRKRIIGGALVIGLVAGSTGLAVAAMGDGDHDRPLAGSDLERATTAALDHTGGGVVIDSEIGDDGAAYSVEIRLDDGRVVEVNLDGRFQVIDARQDEDGVGEHGDG